MIFVGVAAKTFGMLREPSEAQTFDWTRKSEAEQDLTCRLNGKHITPSEKKKKPIKSAPERRSSRA